MNVLFKKLVGSFGAMLGVTAAVVPVMSAEGCWGDPIVIHESADGFKYVMLGHSKVSIVGFPDTEEVILPKMIDGRVVSTLGYSTSDMTAREVAADGPVMKKLTIQHSLDEIISVSFPILEKIEYIDILSWQRWWVGNDGFIHQSINYYYYSLGWKKKAPTPNLNTIELSKGETNNENKFEAKRVYINCIKDPDETEHDYNVNFTFQYKIVKDFFPPGIRIYTDLLEPQIGWEEGWHGGNEVNWGVSRLEFAEGDV